jgi:hypothetical protein
MNLKIIFILLVIFKVEDKIAKSLIKNTFILEQINSVLPFDGTFFQLPISIYQK